ncbi:GSCOCG00011074001-RA-CDS [Cotesia congregata]|nr:GSCOCG00011074001-RA-CDS [Cotesia congregata]
MSPDSKRNGVHAIKSLDHHIITWEALRKSEIVQCKNCQRFNHTAANCNLEYRCVKCNTPHGPGECQLKKPDDTTDRSNLFCVLCHTNGHAASYKGCTKYKEIKTKNQQAKTKTDINKTINQEAEKSRTRKFQTIDPDISYAENFKNTKIPQKHKIEFKNYQIIRRDRPDSKRGGGVAILIKSPIKYEIVNTKFSDNTKSLENIIIRLKICQNKNLFIVATYAAHGNHDKFSEEFNNLFKILDLDHLNNYFIIAGDLNSKHQKSKNTTNNTRDNFLNDWLENNQINFKTKLYTSDIPSYPRSQSYLDLILADCRLKINTKNNSNDVEAIPYDSDHNALSFKVFPPTDNIWSLDTRVERPRLNYKKTDWDRFQNKLNKLHNVKIPKDRNLNREEIDSHLNTLEISITNAIESTVPIVKKNNSVECYINKTIKDLESWKSSLITSINRIYRKFHHNDNEHLRNLKDQLQSVRYLLKLEYNKSINDYWANKVKNIPKNSEKMFPRINQIFRPKGKIKIDNMEIDNNRQHLLGDNVDVTQLKKNDNDKYLITEPLDKLNVLGRHFAKLPNYFTNFTDLAKIFRKINNKKSSGRD